MVTRRSVLLGAAACCAPWQSLLAAAPNPVGPWTGVLETGSRRLPLKVDLAAGGRATLYSLDQGNTPIAGRFQMDEAGRVHVTFKSIRARFAGVLTADERIEGTWQQGVDTPFVLQRGDLGLRATAQRHFEPLDQSALDALRREAGAPALAATASRGGNERIWVAGRRSVGNTAAVTANDLWHVGSITKCMTATLVARLVEAGKVQWDTRVGEVLDDLVPDMNDAYRRVTFRHLLSHRSGMPANLPVTQFLSFVLGDAGDIRQQRRRYARLALEMKPGGAMESHYEYSNNGYVVAAAMLEKLLDATWEDLLQQHLFRPMGLRSAGFGPPDAGAIGGLQQPIGHVADATAKLLKLVGGGAIRGIRPGLGEVADNPRVIGPAGRVHLSLEDLLRYLRAHRDASDYLSAASWHTLHTPPFGGAYAMGWEVRSDGTLWHNGSNNRWYAEVMFNPRTGVVAAAACNESRTKATTAVGTSLLRAAAAIA
jgi:CubicO group peptidase (beta-lactamase class C family)